MEPKRSPLLDNFDEEMKDLNLGNNGEQHPGDADPAEINTFISPRICAGCGRELAEGEDFCPSCGRRADSETGSGDSGHIDQNIPSGKKKNKKAKIVLGIILCILLLIGGTVGGFCVLNAKAKSVIEQIDDRSVDSSEFEDSFSSLGALGKALFGEKIQAAFVQTVKADPYTNYTDDGYTLIYMHRIDAYKRYDAIAGIIGLTPEKSNVCDYIDAVLELEAFKSYNAISKVVHTSIDYVQEALSLEKKSYDYATNKYKRIFYDKAHSAMQNALNVAQGASDGSSYCLLYINALKEINDYYYSQYLSYSSSKSDSSVSSARNTLSDVLSKVTEATNTVVEKIEALPVIEDFNEST